MTSPSAAATPGRNGPPKRRLRNYLLDPQFQLRYAGLLVGVALALMVALGAVILWTSNVAAQQARLAVEQSYAAASQAERAVRESQTTSRIMRMNDLMNAADNPELVQTITQQLEEGDRQAQRNLDAVRHQREEASRQRATIDHGRVRTLWALIVSTILFVLFLGAAGIVITHKVVGPVFKLKRLLRQVGQGRLDIRERLRKGDELEDLFETFLAMVESLKNAQKLELSRLEAAITELESSGANPSALDKLRALRGEMLTALAEPIATQQPPPPPG